MKAFNMPLSNAGTASAGVFTASQNGSGGAGMPGSKFRGKLND
jgi:hypothetical protein